MGDIHLLRRVYHIYVPISFMGQSPKEQKLKIALAKRRLISMTTATHSE